MHFLLFYVSRKNLPPSGIEPRVVLPWFDSGGLAVRVEPKNSRTDVDVNNVSPGCRRINV